ncbi:hypothetical protein [uncultured Brachyspira sp.]|uniref:hypothetical protein n=1 Tax=uncultured Brachyspira sp. TaxID=221953 RepID=UPI0025E1C043|nr:hypothetical protein [uncultured Brachyspira sp.]
MKYLYIMITILAFISCKSTSSQMTAAYKEVHNKEIMPAFKSVTLRDRAGHYKSNSPYFTFNVDLKENGYANVVLKGWMVYRGVIKIGEPSSENKKFILNIDNITHIVLEFKDLNNAKASVVLKDVVQQVLNMKKI